MTTGANKPLSISKNQMPPIRAKDTYVLLILTLTPEPHPVENWSAMHRQYDIFVTRIVS